MATPSTGYKPRRESVYYQKLGKFTDPERLFTPSPLKRRDDWIKQQQSTGIQVRTKWQEDALQAAAKRSPAAAPGHSSPATQKDASPQVDVRELLNVSLSGVDSHRIPAFVDLREELPFLDTSQLSPPFKRVSAPVVTSDPRPRSSLGQNVASTLLNRSWNGRLSSSPAKRATADVGIQLLQNLSPHIESVHNENDSFNSSGRRSLSAEKSVTAKYKSSPTCQSAGRLSNATFIVLGSPEILPEVSKKTIEEAQLLETIKALEEQIEETRKEVERVSSKLRADEAWQRSQLEEIENSQKALEQQIERDRDEIDIILAEKQRKKKENVRLAREFYDRKEQSAAFQAKVDDLLARFNEDKQKVESSQSKVQEWQTLAESVKAETLPSQAQRRSYLSRLVARPVPQQAGRSLEDVRKENQMLHLQLVNLQSQIVQDTINKFSSQSEEVKQKNCSALNTTIHMRDAYDKLKKTDTTVLVDDSVVF